MTRFLFVLVAALCAAPAALADGPVSGAYQNGDGVVVGASRIVAVGIYDGDRTMLTRISTKTGSVEYAVPLIGAWGIPATIPSTPEGVSADGRTLVLGDATYTYPRTRSGFLLVDPKSLRVVHGITLKGDFAYDALSPSGKRLYLIQHMQKDASKYVVRAFDVPTLRLLPGRIADRTQKSWVMQGYPVDRVASPDGRFVYTLYGNPGGFPFVHELDTVKGVAHCIGLPWRGSDTAPYNMRLSLTGTTLRVHWRSGRPWQRVDTRTFAVTQDRHSGFPWWTLTFLLLLVLPLRFWLRDRAPRADEVVQDTAGPGRRRPWDRGVHRHRRDGRPARPERGREVDDARHAARPAAAGRGHGQRLRDTAG